MTKISRGVGADGIDHGRLIQALTDLDHFMPAKADEKWLSIVRLVPANLRAALLLELRSGNRVDDISYSNWPQDGSVVIRLSQRFKNDWADNKYGVEYCFMNDPHYWKADINETVGGVQHLIITPFGESGIADK